MSGPEEFVLGNAAELSVLQKAGIEEAPAVIITTHDDDMNVYLTIYCRRLRPDIQIISRANTERTVQKLHSVGADQVMSYESLAAGMVFNLLRPHGLQILAEGLNLEAHLFGLCCATEDKAEGTQAFIEKRKPEFKDS